MTDTKKQDGSDSLHELVRLLESLRYWEGISECECDSRLPSGGCLKCDCTYGVITLRKLIKSNENHEAEEPKEKR